MHLPVLEPRRLYRQIADQIRDLIMSGKFPRGARLPSERDIAGRLAVSRTSVREALIALEIGGFVEVRGGSGIYVTPSAGLARPLFDADDAGPGPFELLRARWLVEGEIAAQAAKSIDGNRLKELVASIETLERHGNDPLKRDEVDRLFHQRIAEATNNSVLVQTLRMYWDQRRGPMWKRIVEHFHTPALLAAVIADHRSIVAALRARRPTAARRAMRRHLERVEREFAKGWQDAAPRPTQPTSRDAQRARSRR